MPNHIPAHFPALQGLRGVFSLWVVLLHLMLFLSLGLRISAEGFWGEFLSRIFWSGYLAVDGFFILSGFFIAHVFISRHSTPSAKPTLNFLWARLARLYPVHLFVLLVYAVLVWGFALPFSRTCFPHDPAGACDPFSMDAFVKNALLIHAWDWFSQSSWNVNSWSISSEWAAYLFAPLLIIPLARIRNGYVALLGAVVSILLMIAIIPMIERAQYFHHLLLTILERSGNVTGKQLFLLTGPGALEFGLLRVAAEFFSGCLLYKFFQSPLYAKLRWDFIGFASVIAAIVTIQFLPASWCCLVFIPIVLSTAQSRGVVSYVLSRPLMQRLGDMSYSLYMVHGLILKLLMMAIPAYFGFEALQAFGVKEIVALLAGVTLLILAATVLMYHAVEEPCRQYLRKKSPFSEQKTPEGNAYPLMVETASSNP